MYRQTTLVYWAIYIKPQYCKSITKIKSGNRICHMRGYPAFRLIFSRMIAAAADSHAPPSFLTGNTSTTTIFDLFHNTILGNMSRRSPYDEIWNYSPMYEQRWSNIWCCALDISMTLLDVLCWHNDRLRQKRTSVKGSKRSHDQC